MGPRKHVVGAPVRDAVRGYGNDEATARELWTWSEAACGLTYEDVYSRLQKWIFTPRISHLHGGEETSDELVVELAVARLHDARHPLGGR